MTKSLLAAGFIAALHLGCGEPDGTRDLPARTTTSAEAVAIAFREQKSGVHVMGEGVVARILPDDNDGSRHQRFILALASGQTLLVSHNIDIAPRLASLTPGDTVAFDGVYEWNSQGGLIHWTHHDPSGQHRAGWLKHDGRTFQ